MHDFVIKLRLIYFPFLILQIVVILFCSALNYFIFFRTGEFISNQDIPELIIPAIFEIIAVYVWLRPRVIIIRNLESNSEKNFGFLLCCSLFMVLPNAVFQKYLVTVTGKSTHLKTVYDIGKSTKAKYYTFDNYYINKSYLHSNKAGEINLRHISGKQGQNLTFYTYFAIPIQASSQDSSLIYTTWLGVKYSKTISNRLSNSLREIKYQEYLENTRVEINSTDFLKITYFERVNNRKNLEEFRLALTGCTKYLEGENNIILVGQNIPFSHRTYETQKDFLVSFVSGSLLWLVLVFFMKIKQPYEPLLHKYVKKKRFADRSL